MAKDKPVVTIIVRNDDKFPEAEKVWHPTPNPVVIVDTEKDGTKRK